MGTNRLKKLTGLQIVLVLLVVAAVGGAVWAILFAGDTPARLRGIVVWCVVIILFVARALRRAGVGWPMSKQAVHGVHPVITAKNGARPTPDDQPRRLVPIELTRELMGPPPRAFDRSLNGYLHMSRPQWLTLRPYDELAWGYAHQQEIRRTGKVVWACIVQANMALFDDRDSDDCPASVVWSTDPWFDEHPKALHAIAQELYALKGQDQADPEAAAFSRMLTNERTRAMKLRVPSRFTEGRAVYHSSIMIIRKHLPEGHLARPLFPVWLDAGDRGIVLPVPAAYWPASLTSWWKAADDASRDTTDWGKAPA